MDNHESLFTNQPDPELEDLIDEQGVVFRVEPMKTYLAQKQFIGASKLHDIITLTPLQFIYRVLNPPEETEATLFGSALHTYILEPEKFNEAYDVYDPSLRPEKDKTFQSKQNKEWKENFHIACEMRGTIPISLEDLQRLDEMHKALSRNTTTNNILHQEGVKELSIYTKITYNDFTFYVKIRPDFVSLIRPFYLDLKKTRDASPEPNKFPADCFRFGYDIKCSLYYDILAEHWVSLNRFAAGNPTPYLERVQDLKRALIIAIEDEAPFDIAVYNIPEVMLESGRYRYRAGLDRFKTCLQSQKWPGYEIYGANDQGIFDLVLPPWTNREIVI